PLYFMTAKALGAVFGQSLPALSAVSVLSLALLVLISWFGAGVIVDSPRPWIRFWFALAVGTSPAHVWWAQTPKYMMLLYAMYALSLAMGLAFLRKGRWYLAVLAALSTAAVIYTHYVGFFFAAAQFFVLSVAVLWRRDWNLGGKLVAAGCATGLLVAPLLPTVWQATNLRDEEGYNEFYEQSFRPSTFVRGYLMEWNFGYGLLPDKRGVDSLERVASGIARGDLSALMTSLSRVILALVAAAVLGAALANAAFWAYREPSVRLPVVYLAAVAALTFCSSYALGLADRFGYLGYGTWCTLAILTAGFAATKWVRLAVVLQVAILGIHAASLTAYYSNLDRKYPGTRVIGRFLDEREEAIDQVVIDDWIWNVRSAPHNREPLPSRFQLSVVESATDIPNLHLSDGAFAFLAGLREDIEAELEETRSGMPGLSWKHARSWESLEKRERSIHAYVVGRAEPTEH
ncbi:MAG: hypothetical protein ACRD21_13165, partial [Vicinamibacteria bacterium]